MGGSIVGGSNHRRGRVGSKGKRERVVDVINKENVQKAHKKMKKRKEEGQVQTTPSVNSGTHLG